MFDGTGWKTCQESIAIVKSGQNKNLNMELCCMFREKGFYLYRMFFFLNHTVFFRLYILQFHKL